ncbi:Probable DNA endonuclease SmrA [Citrobacter freundii]|nr:Probable DNA endonuclease SmrA [Citrobacter freundii]
MILTMNMERVLTRSDTNKRNVSMMVLRMKACLSIVRGGGSDHLIKYPQQASLNLIRQPVETCRQMLFSFILQAQQEGLRNVLVIHGKGRDDNSHANIIRSYVARWLTEFDDVQAYCAALPHHGGSGACYVALRKTAQAKQDNWERHAKRSR